MLKRMVSMAANTTTKEACHYDTIVIGAGISGLACASRLYEDSRFQGENSLLVLEGRDRIGGRINSVYVNGCRLDTGANWIHGIGTAEKPNPLMSILPHKRYKTLSGMVAFRPPALPKSPAPSQRDGEDGWVNVDKLSTPSIAASRETDSPVIPAETAEQMYGAMWMMIGAMHEMASSKSTAEAKRTSVLQALHETGIVESVLEKLPEEYHAAFTSMPGFVEDMEAGPLAAQSSEHPEGQPGLSLLEYDLDDFEGDQVFLQDGYIAIIKELAKQLVASDLVRTGVVVKQIDWDKKPIVIRTNDKTYSADRVVCTLPLGVLQHSLSKNDQKSSNFSRSDQSPLFNPTLPANKTEAITSLGFGTLDKIFLNYSTAWWEKEPYLSLLKPGIVKRPFVPEKPPSDASATGPFIPDSILGFSDQFPGLSLQPDGTTTPGLRTISIINLNNIVGHPTLCAFISCANAAHVESLSDSAAADLMHSSLKTWFGGQAGEDIPRPARVHVTRWASDRFSRGSYSHMITGLSEPRHRDVLAEPLRSSKGGELRFAGEATSREHFAYAHGALLSGWREADEILGKA